MVLDIGSFLGQYALCAAKLGKDVLAVEPFHDNIIRIHKAALIENLSSRITLVKNIISNERNKVVELKTDSINIANRYSKKIPKNIKQKNVKYMVETILFDDLLNHIPFKDKENKISYKEAIIKVDIQGFEIFAFEHSEMFFKSYKVIAIYMDWSKTSHYPVDYHPLLDKMISLLLSHGLRPFNIQKNQLDIYNWKLWPVDIVWRAEQKETN